MTTACKDCGLMHGWPQAPMSTRDLELAHAQQEVVRSIWLTQYGNRANNVFILDGLYEDAKCSDPNWQRIRVIAADC